MDITDDLNLIDEIGWNDELIIEENSDNHNKALLDDQ